MIAFLRLMHLQTRSDDLDTAVFSRKNSFVGRLSLFLFLGLLSSPIFAWAATVSIVDTATNTSSTLYIGDPFTFALTGGAANSAVTYTVNGAGPYSAGTTDSSGNYYIYSTVPSPAGTFSEVWYVGGVVATPNPLVFTNAVVPTASVSIQDTRTGSSSVLTIGDPFTFTLHNGKPNSAVTYTVNGAGPYSAGTTDSSGSFYIYSTVPTPAASISQVWYVAGVVATPNPLVFTRVSAPSVSIQDNQTGSTSTMTIGDTFTLTVSNGNPNSAVTYTVNGTGPFSAGSTNSNGSYVLNSTVPMPAGSYSQVWYVGGVAATPNPLAFTRALPPAPHLTSISVSSGAPGASVTIAGTNFGSTQGTNTVSFNGTPATVTSWAATQIVALVPNGASTGNIVASIFGVQSNGLAFQVLQAPTCASMSWTPNLGQPIGSQIPFTVNGVLNAQAVNFKVQSQSQTLANAPFYPGAGGSGTYSYTVDTTALAVGPYKVTAMLVGSGVTVPCPYPGFFTLWTGSFGNTQTSAACSSVAGNWTESGTGAVIALSQNGSTVSGTVKATAPGCPLVTWTVSGGVTPSNGQFILTASNPNPNPTGTCAAAPSANLGTTQTPATVQGAACDSATVPTTWNWSPPVTATSTWSMTATLPSSESSSALGWLNNGYSTVGRFSATLSSSSGVSFGGRQVEEGEVTGAANSDGCYIAGSGIQAFALSGGLWSVQTNSSYAADLIGHLPDAVNYYQTYRPLMGYSLPCTITHYQQMSINNDGGQYTAYGSPNVITVVISSTQVSVTRSNAQQTLQYQFQ